MRGEPTPGAMRPAQSITRKARLVTPTSMPSLDPQKHREAFDCLYRSLDFKSFLNLVFPLEDIGTADCMIGKHGGGYNSYHYRRFTCHILSRLKLRDGLRVLNVGAGFGLEEKNIKSLFPSAELWATDISTVMLRLAKTGGCPAQLSSCAAEALPFPDNSFDRICSREVIEHVAEPIKMLKEINRVLKPGGIAVVTTENTDSWSPQAMEKSVQKVLRRYEAKGQCPPYTDDAPSCREMIDLCRNAGLILKEFFWDGALYFFLATQQQRYGKRLPSLAHYFSCIENYPLLASRFCDQTKYVLAKREDNPEKDARSKVKDSHLAYVCPACKGEMRSCVTSYDCPTCGRNYPIVDGIPDFLVSACDMQGCSITRVCAPPCVGPKTYNRNRVWKKVRSKALQAIRACYSRAYYVAAILAALPLKKNYSQPSGLLARDDLYQRYIRVDNRESGSV